MKFLILILILISILTFLFWDQIKIQLMVLIIIQRGLLTTNCFWWSISDRFLEDASGINMYNSLKSNKSKALAFVNINFWGMPMYLVTDINAIKTILDNSPSLFGVGKYKYDFFSSFMKDNVGVSQGCPWKNRRNLNDFVLTGGLHNYYYKFIHDINQLLI